MPRKNVKTALEGVVCCVETKNSDGSDASQLTEKVLRGLGAQVESGVRMGLTHMIWSNGNMKIVKAAEFMDIIVVSPLWVEQCRESGKRVPEEGFIVSPDGVQVSHTHTHTHTGMDMHAPRQSSKPQQQVKVLSVPVAHAADEFEDPGAFSSSQRIMAKDKDATVKEKRTGGRKAGVIPLKSKAAASTSTNKSNSTTTLSSTHQKNILANSEAVVNVDDSKASAAGRAKRRLSPVKADSASNTNSKAAKSSNGKIGKAKSSSLDNAIAPSATSSTTVEDTLSSKSSKLSAKRRRLSSRVSESSDEDSDTEDLPVPSTKTTSATTTKGEKKTNNKATRNVPETNVKCTEVAGKKSTAKGKSEKQVAPKPTKSAKSTPKTLKSDKGSSSSSSCVVDNDESASAVLAVSGFNSDERGLLEDIITSLISKQVKTSKGKKKSKSKSKDTLEGSERHVSLQQSDPQMELQLIKAATSVTHIVTPEDVNSNRTLRILFAMAREVPVLTAAWIYASLDRGKWLWSPENYASFLHPRFNPLRQSDVAEGEHDVVPVYVGKCDDPSKRVVEALVDCYRFTTRSASLEEAALIIMRNPGEADSTLKSKTNKKVNQKVSTLEKSGRIISCKAFFDHIEHNSFPITEIMDASSSSATFQSPKGQSSSPKGQTSTAKSSRKSTKSAVKSAPHVGQLDKEEDDELVLVPPRRGKMKVMQSPAVTNSNKKRRIEEPSASKTLSAKSTKSIDSSRDKGDFADDIASADVDYTDCLVTSPEVVGAFSVTKSASASRGLKRPSAGVDVTLIDSDSPSGSEMSFEVGEGRSPPRTDAKSSRKQYLVMDDDEDEDETAKSSYLSGEGSPCW